VIADQLANLLLARFAPGVPVKVITDGGIYEITDVAASATLGHILLIGEKGEQSR
jgi:hypothetical protein